MPILSIYLSHSSVYLAIMFTSFNWVCYINTCHSSVCHLYAIQFHSDIISCLYYSYLYIICLAVFHMYIFSCFLSHYIRYSQFKWFRKYVICCFFSSWKVKGQNYISNNAGKEVNSFQCTSQTLLLFYFLFM